MKSSCAIFPCWSCQNYRESFAALNKMLEERYQQLIAQLKKELTKYTSMLELAFDPNVNIALYQPYCQ